MTPKFILKPELFKFFGIIYYSCQAIYPYILSPRFVIDGYMNGEIKYIALIEHELIHLKRIKEIGIFKWYIKYVISSKFRLREELLAYKKQIQILRKNCQVVDIDRFAKSLSSFTYLNMVSNDKAKSLLSEL